MRLAAWVWPAGLLPVGGLVAALVWLTSNVPGRGPTVAAGAVAQIIVPSPGFKLREGRTMAVRVRVQPGERPLQSWTLRLSGPDIADEQLASGTLPVVDQPDAQVAAADLTLGEQYRLVLEATDTAGATAEAQLQFLVPDPQYTLIPLEPGNFSRSTLTGLSVDSSGDVASFGGQPASRGLNWDVYVLTSATDTLKKIAVPIGNGEGQQLSPDGQRFFFQGPGTIDYFDLAADALVQGPNGQPLFRVDRTGGRVAYQAPNPTTGTLQYFLYDFGTGAVRELPQDPQAIVYSDFPADCPQTLATTPLISADGQTVAIISRATFGLVPENGNSCQVFVYDVPTASLRHVRSFPQGMALDVPVLSDDGRWLSFTESHIIPQGSRRDFGALLDLQTADLTDPVGGVSSETFDAVISSDGSTIILSTTADLDPRVGNADRNFELFAYDMTTSRFTQISDTTGGISGGSCDRFRPSVNSDARVVLFTFSVVTVLPCQVAAAQRNAVDGLELGRVRAVRRRPGNRAPVFQVASEVRVAAGDQLTLQLSATDPDGDPIVFFAQVLGGMDVPPGSQITDNHDGTATFTWPTTPEQVGLYPLRVAAFDEGGGETFHDLTIAVCARIVDDASVTGVIGAIFESGAQPPAQCHTGELNQDGVITAADVVGAASGAS